MINFLKLLTLAILVVLAIPLSVLAQAAADNNALPLVPFVSQKRIPLDNKTAVGVRLADQWKNHPDAPRPGADGSVKFLFGSTLPTLVCTPSQVCSIRLQAGEKVNDVHAGDITHWTIRPATEGAGASQTTLLIVKPVDAGLETNLLVTTDRRAYTIKLISTQHDWIPILSFDYPDEVNKEWEEYHKKKSRQTLPTGQVTTELDFKYEMKGDNPKWKPVRVYSDGNKTYIQFPSANFSSEAPALIALGKSGIFSSPEEQLVNYHVIGDKYVVDKVLEKAALILGVGNSQTKVVIQRKGN